MTTKPSRPAVYLPLLLSARGEQRRSKSPLLVFCHAQGPSKTAKNSCFGQNAKIVPSEADFIAEYHCGGYFLLKCLTSMIFRIFCGSFSRHFLLARNSPGRPGRNDILPGLPENLKFSLKFEILRQARQNIISAWPAWRVSSQ